MWDLLVRKDFHFISCGYFKSIRTLVFIFSNQCKKLLFLLTACANKKLQYVMQYVSFHSYEYKISMCRNYIIFNIINVRYSFARFIYDQYHGKS